MDRISRAANFALLSSFVLLLGAQQPSDPQSQREGSQPRQWTGRLVDADTRNCNPVLLGNAKSCPVSVVTTTFGLLLQDGRYMKFDEGGNAKAIDALKKSRKASRAAFDFWRTGKAGPNARATVAASLTGDTLNVDSVRIE